jgi:hypothetical protein
MPADVYDPDAARAEAADWISARSERDAALRQLTEAVRAMAFRTGEEAMLDVLPTTLPTGSAVPPTSPPARRPAGRRCDHPRSGCLPP